MHIFIYTYYLYISTCCAAVVPVSQFEFIFLGDLYFLNLEEFEKEAIFVRGDIQTQSLFQT